MPTTIEYSFSWQLLDLNGVTLFDGHQLENSMYKDIGRMSLAKCYKICDTSVRSFNGKTLVDNMSYNNNCRNSRQELSSTTQRKKDTQ